MSGPPIIQDGNRLVVFGSQLIGVVIVIVGLLTQQGQLHSWRPTGTKNQVTGELSKKAERFARLWDDPLEDMPAFRIAKTQSNSAENQSQESPSPAESPASKTPTPGSANYIFLLNILDARPLPEARERRLRIRYAIVSAILAEGYLPLRESVLSPLFEEETNEKTQIGRFETFRKIPEQGNGKYDYVCVIWAPRRSILLPISEDKLKTIKAEIGNRDKVTAQGDVRILHHGSSQDLYNYVAAPMGASPKQSISFMRATIPWKDLKYLGLVTTLPNSSSLQKITPDDILVQALVEELSLRIPALNDTSKVPRVVVFTESDTTYSRAIEHELREKLKDKNVSLEVYSYLRALDGRPEEARAPAVSESSKPQDVATSLFQGRAISETSFGTSQFDYLRRAALDLEGKENRRRNDNVVAVGILGSDIYDKMLVLQAVRPELPSAIFFTTDLDALYLEREMQPFTRNLVVASADGLDANESGDKPTTSWNLPPMRDSYQTVLVKEVRNILTENASEKPGSAHIFEIALGKSIDLDPANQGNAELNRSAGFLRWLAPWWASIVVFVIGLANAFLILWAISTQGNENNKPGEQSTRHAAMKTWGVVLISLEISLACIGLFFLLYELLWSDATLRWGEPLNLGVSIWPSVMIRLLAFIVAIVLLVIASHSFIVYGTLEKEKLEGALPKELTFSHRTGWKRVPATKTFHALLAELVSPRGRKWRIIAASIIYLLVSFFLFWTWPPTVPGRGGWSLLIEKFVLAFGVSLYIIHLVFCIDLHYSALKLLRALSKCQAPGVGQPPGVGINTPAIFAPLGTLTSVMGRTLLYPLTVLILIILSRLRLFDNWVMTPSLTITFALGAIVLVAASLILWLEGARLKRVVLAQSNLQEAERKALDAVNDGVFAAWYNQPIFSAIFSAAAVFGSLTIAGPLTRLLFAS